MHVEKQLRDNKFSLSGAKHVLPSLSSSVYKFQNVTTNEVSFSNNFSFDKTVFPLELSSSKDGLIGLFDRVSKTDLDIINNFEDSEGDSDSKLKNYQ